MHSLLDKLDNCGYFDKEKEEEEEEEVEEEVREGMREREREKGGIISSCLLGN